MTTPEQSVENIEQICAVSNPWETFAPPRLAQEFVPQSPIVEKQITKESFVEQVEFTVSFDRDKLREIELPGKLEHLRETFLRLPERLEFQPGVNLIFGPNGSGKTTLARALQYAIKARKHYDYLIDNGESEEEARRHAEMNFQLPNNRGSDFEDFLAAGAAPKLASAIRIEKFSSNNSGIYCNTQEEVGRKTQLRREMARQPNMRHYGSFMEMNGDAYSKDELVDDASQGLSARQTVDETIGDFIDINFGSVNRNVDIPEDRAESDWDIPEEFKRYRNIGTFALHTKRKNEYYPGIGFIDEPETGMDVKRHIALPDDITTWYPEGSMLIIPTNSTELYRSDLPRIDLSEPEKGLQVVQNTPN